MKKLLFAIFYYNYETGVSNVINIHDDLVLAKVELEGLKENFCKRPSSQIYLFIRPCSFSYSKSLADDVLMSIVKSVAHDLLIAESGFKKGFFKKETFEKSSRWFGFAHSACRRGAAILDIIHND